MSTRINIAAWLLAVVAFLIIYGSLFPFRFENIGAAGLGDLLGRLQWGRTTRSDIAANLLLYLPFGACLAWLMADRLGGLLAILVATLAGTALSLGIELLQLYETRRVSSLADLAMNGLGSFLGGALALAIGSAHRRLSGSGIAGILQHPIAAALVLSWVGYRLSPFAPVFDPMEWLTSIEAVRLGGWLDLGAVLPQALAWLVLLQTFEVLAARGRALVAAGIAMAIVLVGRVLFAGMALEPAELSAMALALLLAHPLAWIGSDRAAAVLAGAMVVMIAIRGLAPFDFQLTADPFGLAPFAESLTHYRATNLSEMFLRCFCIGGLVWLLGRAGLPVLAATLTAGGLLFLVEVLQTWLPGQAADITDPLLAVAAGGLIAVFEGGGRRRRS